MGSSPRGAPLRHGLTRDRSTAQQPWSAVADPPRSLAHQHRERLPAPPKILLCTCTQQFRPPPPSTQPHPLAHIHPQAPRPFSIPSRQRLLLQLPYRHRHGPAEKQSPPPRLDRLPGRPHRSLERRPDLPYHRPRIRHTGTSDPPLTQPARYPRRSQERHRHLLVRVPYSRLSRLHRRSPDRSRRSIRRTG